MDGTAETLTLVTMGETLEELGVGLPEWRRKPIQRQVELLLDLVREMPRTDLSVEEVDGKKAF